MFMDINNKLFYPLDITKNILHETFYIFCVYIYIYIYTYTTSIVIVMNNCELRRLLLKYIFFFIHNL